MKTQFIVGASLASLGWAGYAMARHWESTWGVLPAELASSLPGDDVVPDGEDLLTRGIRIAASPEAIWPWLVQMGFGRAGWYSYDELDMKGPSATEIRPELQSVAVGDILPTHPGGGFEVRLVDQGSALVLYLDDELVAAQAAAATGRIRAADTPGLATSSRFLATASPPTFRVSWAFVLIPSGNGGTWLIERFRGKFGHDGPSSRVLLPVLGFGVFVMVRRQLLGIRERVQLAASAQEYPSKDAVFEEAAA